VDQARAALLALAKECQAVRPAAKTVSPPAASNKK
jgi:hypothetical protein